MRPPTEAASPVVTDGYGSTSTMNRLMLRPRNSHDLRLIQTNLNLSPPATLRWSHDVFGNSIAIASFAEPSPNCGSRAVSNWRQARALPWVSDFTSPPEP